MQRVKVSKSAQGTCGVLRGGLRDFPHPQHPAVPQRKKKRKITALHKSQDTRLVVGESGKRLPLEGDHCVALDELGRDSTCCLQAHGQWSGIQKQQFLQLRRPLTSQDGGLGRLVVLSWKCHCLPSHVCNSCAAARTTSRSTLIVSSTSSLLALHVVAIVKVVPTCG